MISPLTALALELKHAIEIKHMQLKHMQLQLQLHVQLQLASPPPPPAARRQPTASAVRFPFERPQGVPLAEQRPACLAVSLCLSLAAAPLARPALPHAAGGSDRGAPSLPLPEHPLPSLLHRTLALALKYSRGFKVLLEGFHQLSAELPYKRSEIP